MGLLIDPAHTHGTRTRHMIHSEDEDSGSDGSQPISQESASVDDDEDEELSQSRLPSEMLQMSTGFETQE